MSIGSSSVCHRLQLLVEFLLSFLFRIIGGSIALDDVQPDVPLLGGKLSCDDAEVDLRSYAKLSVVFC